MPLHALEIAELKLRIPRARDAADRDRVARAQMVARWLRDPGGAAGGGAAGMGRWKPPSAVYCRPRGWWQWPLVRKGFSCLSDCFRRGAVTDDEEALEALKALEALNTLTAL